MRRGKFEREAFACMTRRVTRRERKLADGELTASLQAGDVRVWREGCSGEPRGRRSLRGEIRGNRVMRHEAFNAADEIRMHVRLGDSNDAVARFRGKRDVAIDIARGIDDDRLVGFVAADDVRGLRE